MKRKIFIRLTAMLLALATLAIAFSGCMTFPNSDPEESTAPPLGSEVPYFEHYIANDLIENAESGNYRGLNTAYIYKGEDSKPIVMGGEDFYYGFTINAGFSELTEQPLSFVTFDISEYEGNTLSFVMGSAETNGNNADAILVMEIKLDDEQVLEEKFYSHDTYRHFTLDLTGRSKITFTVTQGYKSSVIGVAEITVWDSPNDVVRTGPTPDTSVTRAQLGSDLFPYFFPEGTSEDLHVHTTATPPRHITASQSTYNSIIRTEPVSVGGKTYMNAFSLYASSGLTAAMNSKDTAWFNTEGLYGYLSFMIGTEDESSSWVGSNSGTAWITVYADQQIVLEERVYSDSLPVRYAIPISNCQKLGFEVAYEEGGYHRIVIFDAFVGKTETDAAGTAAASPAELPDVCKLISDISPYTVVSQTDDAVFYGDSQYRTFTVAGRQYNEGLGLISQSDFFQYNYGAHAIFNLEGQFKYLTFKAGLIDKSSYIADDQLNIYLDGELSVTLPLYAMQLPQEYTVELKNCSQLKIELAGRDGIVHPAWGFFEMVVYKNEVVEHDLFHEEEVNYPDNMPLIENIAPYMIYNSKAESKSEILYDGSTKKHYFTIDSREINSGVILQTSVHLDLLGTGGMSADGVWATMIALPFVSCPVALLAAGTLYENSLAAFDLRGEFKTVTFTVANTAPDWYISGMQEETNLLIGSDHEVAQTIVLSRNMKPTTYTVNIEGTEQLMFFLECVSGTSSPYAIYDIAVGK